MLINLSNHPHTKWSDHQKETALRMYGEVMDMEFPHIDPSWSKDQVYELAENYLSKIKLLPPATIHIMGELTFTYIFVNIAKKADISCIASTTERIVQEKHGQKLVEFWFGQFRPYF